MADAPWSLLKRITLLAATGRLAHAARKLARPPGTPQPIRLSWQSPLLALAVIALLLAGTWTAVYVAAKRSVTRTANDNLAAVATLKVGQIEQWLEERKIDAQLVTRPPHFSGNLQAWLKGGMRDQERQEILLDYLRQLTRNHGYRDASIRAVQDGALLLTSGGDMMDSPPVRAQAKAAATGAHVEDLHFTYPGSESMDVGFFSPIRRDANSPPLAILHITLDPVVLLFPVVTLWPGSSPSAETFLARIEGDEIVCLSPLRDLHGSALRLRLPRTEPRSLTARASAGASGLMVGTDYRDVPSLGHVLPIAGTPWLLIAKIDAAEVYGEFDRMALFSATIAVLLLLAGTWWITERNRVALVRYRDQLERSILSKRIEFLARFANDSILLSDAHGRIIEVNDRALAIYGYTHAEMIGLDMSALRATASDADTGTRLAKLPMDQGLIYETEHRRKDGTLFPVEVSARLIEFAGEVRVQEIVRDISMRVQTARALRDSEARFRQLFDLAPIGMAIVAPDGSFVSANTALQNLVGFGATDLRTRTLPDLTHLNDRKKAQNLFRQLVAGDIPRYSLEKQILHASGRVLWVQQNATIVKDGAGTPLYCIVQFLDISERKKFIARIERLSRLYAAISGTNQAIVHCTTPQEVYKAVCSACVELGRLQLAWVGIADAATQRIVPVAAAGGAIGFLDDIVVSTDPELPEGRGPTGIAYRERRIHSCGDYFADPGTRPWYRRAAQYGVASSIALPLMRGGKACGALTVYGAEKNFFDTESTEILREMANNISFFLDHFDRETQRRQAEEKLADYAHQIEDLYQNAPCGYHSIDGDGRVVRINDTELRWLGYSRDEVADRLRLPDLLSEAGRRIFLATFPSLKSGDGITDLETEMLRKDGTILPVILSASAVRSPDGEFLFSRTTVYDITERRKIDQERAAHAERMRALSHRLVAVQETERRRLAEALHDQTSPNLAAISIMLGTMGKSLPERARAEVEAGLADARTLVKETTSHIREICANLRPSLLDYSGLVPSLTSYAQQFSRRAGIAVRIDATGARIRPATETESLLFRIAQEALTNCAKHACARNIDVTLTQSERHICLTIADDGVGFAVDQLGSPGNAPGLGLITMRERAEFAGGTLNIDSRPGQGTTISVYLETSGGANGAASVEAAPDHDLHSDLADDSAPAVATGSARHDAALGTC